MNAAPKPQPHDIEKVYPHLRKHLRPFGFNIRGAQVTIWGLNADHAKKRYRAMSGDGSAFSFRGKRKEGGK